MADLLEEFAPGRLLDVGILRVDLALGDGPVAEVLAPEEWPARMNQQNLEAAFSAAK